MTTTGATTPGAASGTGRHRKGYFLPGAIALLALLGLGVFLAGGGDLSHPAARTLDGPTIASQIALGIQTEQNTARAPSVSCPAAEPVHQGLQFTCTAGPSPGRTVYVTEVDGRGRIRWAWTHGT